MSTKRFIHSLMQAESLESCFSFTGTNGVIEVILLSEGIFQVEYHFSHLQPCISNEKLLKVTEPAVISETFSSKLTETDDAFIIESGDDRLVVEKRDGLLSLYHRNRLVHGGSIGSADTVVPRFPLRIVNDSGRLSKGRLNFRIEKGDRFFGLGEKSGALNRRDRRFEMFNRDALGYDAGNSDPLYKAIPFLIRQGEDRTVVSGLYQDNPYPGTIDLGKESIFYYSLEFNCVPFRFQLYTGDTVWDIIEKFTRMTGRPALPPLYTFGFLGSSMNYTEPDDADERVTRYFDKIEECQIPCEGFYFSSGYIKAENGERYTFEWNRKKFPNPNKTISKYRDRGYHIAANIKPGFLITHPKYKWLSEMGYFITDNEGNPYVEYYWGKNASFIDFTNPKALEWWKEELREKFVDIGISGIWNDNNELELEDEGLDAQMMRLLYPVYMAKASWDVYREAFPEERPWVISRAGGPGIQHYARSWTGDNTSDWISLRNNKLMGLGLGLSGFPFYGHDIGGFFGDTPDTEQFIRWCQSAVFQPRFVIHSWNPDGNPTELWSYPEYEDILRELVLKHYEFMPYIYNTAITASITGIPMERPLGIVFQNDNQVDIESPHYMFGEDILVLSVLEQGIDTVACYLPDKTSWYDSQSKEWFVGGEEVTFSYPLYGVKYLLKAGSIIPTAPGCTKLDTGYFNTLCFLIVPDESGVSVRDYYEDDGKSIWRPGSYSRYRLELNSTERRFSIRRLELSSQGINERSIVFMLPDGWSFDLPGEPGEYQLNVMPKELNLTFQEIK